MRSCFSYSVSQWKHSGAFQLNISHCLTGPINNIIIVRQPMNMLYQASTNEETSFSKRQRLSNLPSLDKYVDSTGSPNVKPVSAFRASVDEPLESRYCSSPTMMNHIRELQVSPNHYLHILFLHKIRIFQKRDFFFF